MIFTSVILVSGFSILAFSGFSPSAEMGILTAIIIIAALVADLFMFPAILIFFDTFIIKKDKGK